MLDKVKVGGVHYTVEKDKEVVIIGGSTEYYGMCSYDDSRIEILKGLSEDREKECFAHELVHAMLFEAGFSDHDEDFVKRLGIVLNQVLQDNDFSFMRDEIETESFDMYDSSKLFEK